MRVLFAISFKVQSWTGFTSLEHSMTDAAEDTDP